MTGRQRASDGKPILHSRPEIETVRDTSARSPNIALIVHNWNPHRPPCRALAATTAASR